MAGMVSPLSAWRGRRGPITTASGTQETWGVAGEGTGKAGCFTRPVCRAGFCTQPQRTWPVPRSAMSYPVLAAGEALSPRTPHGTVIPPPGTQHARKATSGSGQESRALREARSHSSHSQGHHASLLVCRHQNSNRFHFERGCRSSCLWKDHLLLPPKEGVQDGRPYLIGQFPLS